MSGADVIIVGAGPAGCSTAWALARSGIDVLVIDRARFPRDKACSEYLSPEASRILAAMRALASCEAAGAAQLAGMVVRAPNGACIRGDYAAGHGFRGFRDRGLALRRRVLDSIVLERAREAGARALLGTRVTDLAFDARGRVCGVRTLESDGTTTERHARLVVGADGLRSIVARRLGLARAARFPRRLALVTHFRGVRDVGEYGEMHVERDGYVGIAAVGQGTANVAVVVPLAQARAAVRDRAAFLEGWIAARAHLAPRFAPAERASPVLATGPFASRAKRAWAPGAALVGDAADFFDPFTGEGIYTALRGGELLANAIVNALGTTRPAAEEDALRAYEVARHREFGGKWIVERLVGTAVAFPSLMNRAANVLAREKEMADLLVGVAGDFVPPRAVLNLSYLLRFVWPRRGRAMPDGQTGRRADGQEGAQPVRGASSGAGQTVAVPVPAPPPIRAAAPRPFPRTGRRSCGALCDPPA